MPCSHCTPTFRLAKRLEEVPDLLLRDAPSGILDFNVKRSGLIRLAALAEILNSQDNAARVGELDSIAEQIDQNLAQFPLIGDDRPGHTWHEVYLQMQFLIGSAQSHELLDLPDRFVQVKTTLIDGNPPRLNSGHVQDIIDQVEEMLPAPLDNFQALALFRRRLSLVDEEIGKSQDGIERRAQLVIHIRQESALGAVGGFELLGTFFDTLFQFHGVALRQFVQLACSIAIAS